MINTTLLIGTDAARALVQNPLSTRRPIPLPIIITLCGCLAILCNGSVLIVLLKNPNLLGSTRKFCMHLAITDLGNGFLSFILIYTIIASERNVDLCVNILLVVKFFVLASQFIVTVNNFERYVGICKRQTYLRIMKKSTVNILLFMAWLFPLILALGSMIGFSPSIYESSCYYHLMFNNWVYLTEAAVMFSLASLNIVLFGFIISKAMTFYNKVTPASLHGTSNTAVRNRELKKSIRNGKMMGMVTTAFLLCWMPYNVYQIYVGMGETVSDNVVSAGIIMYIFGLCNSFINPFIYIWQKKEFRLKFKLAFKCAQSREIAITDVISTLRGQDQQCPSKSNATESIAISSIGKFQQRIFQNQETTTSSNNEEHISTVQID